jgi:thymidylate synthase
VNGNKEKGRNGNTLSLFGKSLRFSLKDNKIPILTTKKVAWKTCLKELLWFVRGETDNLILQNQNVNIWDLNSSREYLDSVGLINYNENELGPIYGHQWRNFNGVYIPKENGKYSLFTFLKKYMDYIKSLNYFEQLLQKQISVYFFIFFFMFLIYMDNVYISFFFILLSSGMFCSDTFFRICADNGVDQLQNIIDLLKNPETRNSRRIVMSSWNPCQLHEMALPPCHILCQFNVHDNNKLSCAVYQRSGDMGLGVPFNIASYSFLTHLIAKHCNLEASELILFLGNCHIYEEHIEALTEQVKRKSYEFPTLQIKNVYENINDYTYLDFLIKDYKCNDEIKMVLR